MIGAAHEFIGINARWRHAGFDHDDLPANVDAKGAVSKPGEFHIALFRRQAAPGSI